MIRVAPGGRYPTIASAAAAARDGDVVEIAPGVYRRDTAIWRQSSITIRGVGERPVIDAEGTAAADKGIFVISGRDVRVEHLEFANAKATHKNGAGIRLERGGLVVCDVVFRGNEEGILTGPDPNGYLEIHDTAFIDNAFAYSEGYSHALYVGELRRLVVTGSYFTGTEVGHSIKSRARNNRIAYNWLSAERGFTSYEIDLPNGGVAVVVGNVIEQGERVSNPALVSFGAEMDGLSERDELTLVNNTLVNRYARTCSWINHATGARVTLIKNLFVGKACGYNGLPEFAGQGNATALESPRIDPSRPDSLAAARLAVVPMADRGAVPVELITEAASKGLDRRYRHTAKVEAIEPPYRGVGAIAAP